MYSCSNRILVLKDGQIFEQGTHKELLELNGVFAAMWADQISAIGEQVVDNGPREAPNGYQIDDVIPTSEPADIDAAPTQDTAEPLAETSEAPIQETPLAQESLSDDTRVPILDGAAAVAGTQVDDTLIAFPSSNEGAVGDEVASKVNPVAFPTSDSAPIAFPVTSSDEAASQKAPSTAQNPGITFAPEVGTPERTGTPDPDAEPKRKRISSQNFQRLARRISVTTRRAGSISGIPILGNLRREGSSAASGSAPAQVSTSTEDGGAKAVSQSPATSIHSEPDKDKSKKKEKEKKRRTFI